MTPSSPPPDRLFILEDDQDLLGELVHLACDDCGYEVTTVRCVEDALEVARKAQQSGLAFRLALIDVMVPQTNANLVDLDQQLMLRSEVVLRKRRYDVGAGPDTDCDSLIGIDRRIQDLVNIDGGRYFFENALKEHLFGNCSVAFFTARAIPDPTKFQTPAGFLDGRQVYWLQKPLDPDALIEVLNKERSRIP